MTRTALENKKIQSQERIEGGKLDQKKKEFKHKRVMDWLSFFKPGKSGMLTSMLSHNDPAWYKTYVKDLDKFTNVATFVRNGLNDYDGYLGSQGDADTKIKETVSGLMVFDWIPSINTAHYSEGDLGMEPVNQILMRTKEQVLKSNSRSSVPYEAADLGLNFLATASILGAICEYERLVMLAQTYTADNAYYPSAYLNALGTIPYKWTSNLADARKNLILLKQRFNTALVAPAELTLYSKYAYLGSLWVKDSETHPYSVYATRAQYFLQLSSDGSYLNAITPDRSTPESFYITISTMIQAIAENPDYVEMYADLRSAVRNLVQLNTMVDQSGSLEATYDSMALEQLANFQTLPAVFSDELRVATIDPLSIRISQTDSGYLYQGLSEREPGIRFQFDGSTHSTSGTRSYIDKLGKRDAFLNLHTDQIDGNVIIDASRPKLFYESIVVANDETENEYFRVSESDMVIFTRATVYGNSITTTNEGDGSFDHTVNFSADEFSTTIVVASTETNALTELMHVYGHVSRFMWAPLIEYHVIANANIHASIALGEVAHLVPVGRKTLSDINVACGLGLLYLDTNNFKL